MNKYKVTRHCERNGYENTIDSVVFSTSEERAISIVRYSTTRSDKLPNGELTNYTTDDGTHIWWTAEQVEIDHPETAPAPELETDDDSFTEALNKLMNIGKNLEEAISTEKPAAGDSVHVIALGDYADKFRKIKTTLGLKKNTAAFAAILDAYEKQDITASTFSLSDDLEARVAQFAEVFNTNRDEIIAKAVISYLNRLGGMTLNELIRRKEAKHDT